MVRPRLTIYVCQESQQLRDLQQKHEDGDTVTSTFFGKGLWGTAAGTHAWVVARRRKQQQGSAGRNAAAVGLLPRAAVPGVLSSPRASPNKQPGLSIPYQNTLSLRSSSRRVCGFGCQLPCLVLAAFSSPCKEAESSPAS